jgi:RNA polymerase sigma-70 factor, ECF subfamily
VVTVRRSTGSPDVAAGGAKVHLHLVGARRQPSAGVADDVDLVAAFRLDATNASAAIWERYYPLVRRVLARAIGPRHDVEDLVQEVFLRLYRKLPSLRDPALLRNFILAITAHVLKGDLRTRWLRRWLRWGHEDQGEMPEPATEDVDRDAREALGRLYRILDGLSPRHRAAFVLRHIEGLELLDVAAALGISLATAKRWLPRISLRVFAQAKGDPTLAPYLQEGRDPALTHG